MSTRQVGTSTAEPYSASLSHPGSGGWTTLVAELLAVAVFLIWTRPLWRSWLRMSPMSRDDQNGVLQLVSLPQYPSPHPIYYVPALGIQKQVIGVEGSKVDMPVPTFSTDVDSREVRTIDVHSDGPAAPVLELFENREDVVYPEKMVTTSRGSEPDPGYQARPQSPITSPLLGIPARALNTSISKSAQPRTLSVVLETRKPYVASTHSVGARTLSSSMAYTGNFSRSTSSKSTLPPSYRSNRPTAYLAPTYTYPLFPPPTYAPPPSAFRMSLIVPESLRPGSPESRRNSLDDLTSGSRHGYEDLDASVDQSGIENASVGGGRVESGTSRVAEGLRVY